MMEGGLDWIGLEWMGLEWMGLEWIGVEWMGVEWKGKGMVRCFSVSAFHLSGREC